MPFRPASYSAAFAAYFTLLGGHFVFAQHRVAPEVHSETKHDTSPPLRNLYALPIGSSLSLDMEYQQNAGPAEAATPQADSSQQTAIGVAEADGASLPVGIPKKSLVAAQVTTKASVQSLIGLNFDGVGGSSSTWPVPDSNGAVGATQYVEWVNVQFAIYDKRTGNLVYGPVAANTLWSGFGGPCETRNDGDPIVQYDKAAGKWVMTHHATPPGGPYYQCVAVSTTSDATGSYNRYAFQLSTLFLDYPKVGVWPDAYYISFNLLNQNNGYAFINPLVCALDRNAMRNGTTATSVCFQVSSGFSYLLPSDLDGSTAPPAGSPNYFISLGSNSLNLWRFHVDFQSPANSTFNGPLNVPVSPFIDACPGGTGLGICVPQLGTTQHLDSLRGRIMYRVGYRNLLNGPESLVITHSVGNPTGIRWYELRSPGLAPFIWQQGTFAPDSSYRWNGSIGMDRVGDIAVGYSLSAANTNPGIRYTGRLASEALGTMEAEATIIQGTASQQTSSRWGDYSTLSIDPVDDCTFWYTNQYILANGNWQTRVANFKFSVCSSTPQPVTLSTTNPFGNQQVGTTSSPQNVILTNHQGFALSITSISTNGDFAQTNNCGTSVAAASSCTIAVTFTPATGGTRNGSLVVGDDASNSPQTANLTGNGVGPAATLSPTNLSFYYQPVGTTSSPKLVTLTNEGSVALSLGAISASGNYGETDNCAGTQLQPAASCNINVTFSPSTSGSLPGILTVNDSAGNSPQLVSLSGPGIKPVSLIPVSMAFGTVNAGQTSAAQTATVTNNQTTSLNLSFSASGYFAATGTSSAPCGLVLAPKAKCTIAVLFSPKTNGNISGSLTVSHNALFSPQVVDLSGTGANGSTAPLSFSPTSLLFSKIALGTTSTRNLAVTNSSGSTVNISGIVSSGNYSLTPTNPCVGALAAGATCTFTVSFRPTNLGTINGGVTVSDDAAVSKQVLDLKGTTVLPVTFSTPNPFGPQSVGTTSPPQTITLTNNQNTTVSILGITVSGDYILTSAGSNPCGGSVGPLQQCNIGVEFSPTVTGTIAGVLTVNYNASSSPQEVVLTGTAN